MRISYNNGSTFRGCKKKYYWRYIERLEPIVRLPSLITGAILHEGFDLFFKGTSDIKVLEHITGKFNEAISQQEASDQEDLIIAKYIATGMWLHYPYKSEKFEMIASEEEFTIPMDNFEFVGRVDGRAFVNSHWWVRELKTTGLSQRQFEGRCETSAQGTGYVYGMQKLGFDVKGLLYDYIKKPLLRKGITESVDDFGRRIVNDYKMRQKLYYNRYYSYRSPIDLKNFEDDITALADDIIETTATKKFYRNTDQCWNFGSCCPYASICFAEKPDPLTLKLYFNKKKEVEDVGGEKGKID